MYQSCFEGGRYPFVVVHHQDLIFTCSTPKVVFTASFLLSMNLTSIVWIV